VAGAENGIIPLEFTEIADKNGNSYSIRHGFFTQVEKSSTEREINLPKRENKTRKPPSP
jgi:hypothetical protein